MLQIHTMSLGTYQTNCYIVFEENAATCVVIDPGCSAEVVLEKAKCLGKTIEAVLLTHGHFDHVGGVQTIVEKTGCALWMREGDWTQPGGPEIKQLFPLTECDFCEVNFFEDGQMLDLAGTSFAVYETPGHTWGSVCIKAEENLFTGDTLFAGSWGRTDFPGSSWSAMRASLDRLAEMEGDFTVYPGHGPSTTLSYEKLYNPCLQPKRGLV